MSDLLVWLEATGPAVWTRESPSLWAYPTILTLHTVGLAMVVGLAAAIDLRVLGVARRVPLPALLPAYRLIGWGFALNAASGALLFVADAIHKASQPVLYVKLASIAGALWFTLLLRRVITTIPGSGRDGSMSEPRLPGSARPVAVASLLLWLGAIMAGRLMAYL